MNFKKYASIVLLLSLVFFDFGEGICQVPVEKSVNKVIIEGKLYYIHMVKPGQTLYSISRAYEIPETEIISENPGIDKVMPVGQALKIPVVSAGQPGRPAAPQLVEKSGFIINTGREKETFFSVSRSYNLPVQELEKANPGIDYSTLSVGQQIYIPQPGLQPGPADFIYHRVKRRDTMYGISRKYGITEEELRMYNPDLRGSYPHPGQRLRIPVKKKTEKPVAMEVTSFPVHVADTLKPLAVPDTLKEELTDLYQPDTTYDFYVSLPDEIPGKSIDVAFLIPFDYSVVIDTFDFIKNPREIARLRKQAAIEDLIPASQNFLEFMEGSLLAIDILSKRGISVRAHFFDTKQSNDRIREVLNSEEFRGMDLIVGPFYSFNLAIVSDYALEHRIPVVSPFYNGSELTFSNPLFFQANPSFQTEFDLYGKYIAGFSNSNLVMIYGNDSLGIRKALVSELKSKIFNNLRLNGSTDTMAVQEIVHDNTGKRTFNQLLMSSLSRTKENVIIIPETDEVTIPLSAILTQLYFQRKNYNYRIRVIGMPNWITFQSIDFSYFHELELSYLTPYHFSYDSTDVKNFLKEYTSNYFAEPVNLTRKVCPFAFIGYDVSYYFLDLMSRYGRRFIYHLEEKSSNQLLNDFHFVKVNGGGFENRSLMLVKYMKDMTFEAEKFTFSGQ